LIFFLEFFCCIFLAESSKKLVVFRSTFLFYYFHKIFHSRTSVYKWMQRAYFKEFNFRFKNGKKFWLGNSFFFKKNVEKINCNDKNKAWFDFMFIFHLFRSFQIDQTSKPMRYQLSWFVFRLSSWKCLWKFYFFRTIVRKI
jgi:hypothetical protein